MYKIVNDREWWLRIFDVLYYWWFLVDKLIIWNIIDVVVMWINKIGLRFIDDEWLKLVN